MHEKLVHGPWRVQPCVPSRSHLAPLPFPQDIRLHEFSGKVNGKKYANNKKKKEKSYARTTVSGAWHNQRPFHIPEQKTKKKNRSSQRSLQLDQLDRWLDSFMQLNRVLATSPTHDCMCRSPSPAECTVRWRGDIPLGQGSMLAPSQWLDPIPSQRFAFVLFGCASFFLSRDARSSMQSRVALPHSLLFESQKLN